MIQNLKEKRIEMILLFAILLLVEIIYFRNVLFSTALIGDSGDTRLNNLILEHWYKVFIGQEKFSDLIIFYPVSNTITYTDLLLGYSVPYILLRVVGIGLYMANKIVIILLHSFGTASLLVLLRKVLSCTWLSTIVGVIAFSLSNAILVQAGHSQLYALCIVPLLILFIILFFKSIKENKIVKKRYGVGIILSYIWIMYTSFYIAFFSALLIIIYGLVVFCMSNKKQLFKNIKVFISLNYKVLLVYVLLSVILVIPFFIMYLPTLKLFGLRHWGNICVFLPNMLDYINVSGDSYLYGSFKEKYNLSGSIELSTGIPVLTMIIFIVCYILIRKFYYEKKSKKLFYIRALCVTVISTWILLLKSDEKSLWWFIYKIVPGGGAIRVPFRINMIIVLLVAIIIAFTCTYLYKKISSHNNVYYFALVLLSAVILVDNATNSGIYSYWDLKEISAQIDSVPEPPEDCEVFVIKDSGGVNREFHDYNLLAWEIADKFNLKTVNGYSGQFPDGWPINGYIYDSNSLFALYNWIDLYDLNNVYIYDVNLNVWTQLEKNISYWYDENNKSILIDKGYINEDKIILHPDGYTWGPYMTLSDGEYIIRIESDNIKETEFECVFNGGQSKVELKQVDSTDNMIIYEFGLPQDIDNVEFKLYNLSDQDIEFNYIEVIKVQQKFGRE